jgi:Tol biopolymer transport system component
MSRPIGESEEAMNPSSTKRRAESRRQGKGIALIVALLGVVGAASAPPAPGVPEQAPSANGLLQQAIHQEEALGDAAAAIGLYKRLLAADGVEHVIAARAELRLAMLLEKIGQASQAREHFAALVEKFGADPELASFVAAARAALATAEGSAQGGGAIARQVWAGPDVDASFARVSADGKYLAFTDWETGDLAIRDLATGEKRRLTDKGSALDWPGVAQYSAFSPDGSRLAYVWANREGFNELRLIGIDGGEPRVLYRNEEVARIWGLDWAPDGTDLVAVFDRAADRTNQLVLVSVTDGSTRVLKSFDWRIPFAAYSPDGRHIAYNFPPREDQPQRDLFLMSRDGSREVPLVEHPADDSVLGWSPDGSRLLFASNRTGSNGIWGLRVSDGRPQGDPELLQPDIGRVVGGSGITRTGDFYYALNIGVQDVYIATVDPATGHVTEGPTPLRGGRFFGGKTEAAWSPDGEHLAYISQSPLQGGGAAGTLSIHTLQTGQVRDIPLQLRYAAVPTWLPDGHAIIVWGPDVRGRRGFYRVDLSSGRMERIVPVAGRDTPEPGRFASLSADGTKLFYWVGIGQGIPRYIRMLDLETADDREIYPDQVGTFALSPDGHWLAVLNEAGIQVIPASGGEPRATLVPADANPGTSRHALAWTPDGRFLLFPKYASRSPGGQLFYGVPAEPHELWRVPADGGAAQKLDLPRSFVSRISFHPDGRRLAISAGRAEFEIWALEGWLKATDARPGAARNP